ncbi:hypothetical protein HAX54_015098, partial [Datura stramonium]|nr:hypothetical protein [Datura stramonium]
KVVHKESENHYSFDWKDKITIEPLEPNEVLNEKLSLNSNVKSALRKEKDERQKIERSEGEQGDTLERKKERKYGVK